MLTPALPLTDILWLAALIYVGIYGWTWAIDQWDDEDFVP